MNRPAHLVAGALTAAGAYYVIKESLGEKLELGEALLVIGGGALTGIVPDILEPATSPHHRGFCHSKVMFAALGYLFYRVAIKKDILNSQFCAAISALIAAYGSHLILDSSTPMGLPLITSRI